MVTVSARPTQAKAGAARSGWAAGGWRTRAGRWARGRVLYSGRVGSRYMIVDAHSHIAPPDLETMPDLGGRQPQAYMRDVDRLFRLQDEGGVNLTVLSIPTLVESSLRTGPEAALDAIRR